MAVPAAVYEHLGHSRERVDISLDYAKGLFGDLAIPNWPCESRGRTPAQKGRARALVHMGADAE